MLSKGGNGGGPMGRAWERSRSSLSDGTNHSSGGRQVGRRLAGRVGLAAIVGILVAGASVAGATPDGFELVDNFNDGLDEDDWSDVNPPDTNDDCGAVSPPTALFFGGAVDRRATTVPLDATRVETIAFHIKFGSGPEFPCKDDSANRDVDLQYSGDGENWTTITTIDDDSYKTWTHLVFQIPDEASNPGTFFRWHQEGPDHIGRQQWAIDDVYIGHNLTQPRNLVANPGTSWGSTTHEWSDPAVEGTSPVEGYRILRGTTEANLEPVATVGPDTLTYEDTGLDSGSRYLYQVVAFSDEEESPPSEVEDVVTAGPTILRDSFDDGLVDPWRFAEAPGGQENTDCGSASGPRALTFSGDDGRSVTTHPLNLTPGSLVSFELRIGSPQSMVSNPDCDDAVVGHDVHLSYSTDGENWTLLETYGANGFQSFAQVTQRLPAGAWTGHTQVRLSQPTFDPGWDDWSVDDLVVGPVPSEPRNVTAQAQPGGSVTVTWETPESSSGFPLQAYEVLRERPSGEPQVVATVDPSTHRFQDEQARAHASYTYRVVAVTRAGPGVASAPATAQGAALPQLDAKVSDPQNVTIFDDRDGDDQVDEGEVYVQIEEDRARLASPSVGVRLTPLGARPVEGPSPNVEVPRTCTPERLVCVGPTGLETLPGDPAVPGTDVQASGGLEVTVDTGLNENRSVAPVNLTTTVPFVGEVPIVVCADGCALPLGPEAHATPDASLEGKAAGVQTDGEP